MATLTDLANEMEALAKRIGNAANQAAKDVATTVLTDLVQVTPADVGTAISNWRITIDSPAVGILGAYVPSPRGRTKNGDWVHAVDPIITAQANVPPTLQHAQAVLSGKSPGQVIFITNNLPYIETLNNGSSEQAPAGYVDRAVILGGQAVSKVKI